MFVFLDTTEVVPLSSAIFLPLERGFELVICRPVDLFAGLLHAIALQAEQNVVGHDERSHLACGEARVSRAEEVKKSRAAEVKITCSRRVGNLKVVAEGWRYFTQGNCYFT